MELHARNLVYQKRKKQHPSMTADQASEHLDRVCELIDLGLTCLGDKADDKSSLGRTALRLAKSEVARLKDECLLANALAKSKPPSFGPPQKTPTPPKVSAKTRAK